MRAPGVSSSTGSALDEDDDRIPSEVTATKRIGVSGNSLTLSLTEELRMMGLDYGDLVQVTVRRITR